MGDQQEKIDTTMRPHNVEKVAEDGFGKNATEYDKHRPGYSEQSIKIVLEEIMLPKEICPSSLKYEILELGAGTGKLTELVAPKLPSEYRYLATEPSLNFLDQLRSKSLPVETANISACKIPLPDNSVQNILCGQCLHWFSDVASLKEIHRILVPGGKLIPLWNVKKFDENAWMREICKQRFEVMKRTGSSTMFMVSSMEWKKVLDDTGLFTVARHETLPGIRNPGNIDTILNHMRTVSCYNLLPEDELQGYMDQLRQNILSHPGVNPDDMTMPFSSLLYVFKTNNVGSDPKN